MTEVATDQVGYDLLHAGVLAFADIERNGIRVDEEYLEALEEELHDKIARTQVKLLNSELGSEWKELYEEDCNWESSEQLECVLFDEMRIKSKKETNKGGRSVDQEVLLDLQDEVDGVDHLLGLRKWNKCLNTYVKNIIRNTVNGYLYVSFNLHTVRTYRSSSSDPNFQNIPIRDPEIGKMIRRAFIARPGRMLVEVDFSGLEVRIAACYHKDRRMMEYINDPTKDMHRDMAMECFLLPEHEVTKLIRYVAKNRFVFPSFYGSYYATIAPDMWKAIVELNLETKSGVPLKKHLKKKGIKNLKQFTDHIEKVEKRFWQDRFKEYAQWKKEWYNEYLEKGWFETKTGFTISGEIKRNDVINYPVQGAAFHCLLWCVIQLQDYLEGRKSIIVGQIHDSIVLDVHPKELQDLLNHMDYLMCRKLQNTWKWINVPLETEVEVADIDTTWYDKKEWVKLDGKWQEKPKED